MKNQNQKKKNGKKAKNKWWQIEMGGHLAKKTAKQPISLLSKPAPSLARTKSKYRREWDAQDDRLQTVLTPNGRKLRERRPTHVEFQYKNTDMQVMCPFCLHNDPLHKFLISTKHGVHKGLGCCPECKNQMRFESLVNEWTPEQYAEWVYPYSASGFWQKIPYQTWGKRLKQIGWSWRFWTRYKQLKGEEPHETYAEHMEKEQEEWAKKEGLIE